jgi:CheY-like chemotaxis protein/anti-sigma regulatory factor (Ser/Thr protein kinase)
VDGDAARLAQVVSNLLTNAAKYTEPGGQIVVAAGRDGDAVALSVRDSGVGIDADMLPRVFDLFTQAPQNLDRSQGGLGIGLAIVRSLVMLHGGTVTAASAGPGRGSTFTIRLPFAPIDQPARREEARAPAASAAAPDGARVLIVDDNQDSADMIAELITSLGHETRIAHDGPAALAVVQTFRPDVALLDIGLPVMDGYELGRRLKSDAGLPGIRLVAVTGYGQPRDREASAGAGFDAHLVKPVNLDELTGLLAQLTKPSGQVPS